MRRNTHYDTAAIFRVYKRCRKYQNKGTGNGICDFLTYQLFAFDFPDQFHQLICEFEFIICFFTYYPYLIIYPCLHMKDFRIDPQVRYPEYGLRAKCGAWEDFTLKSEFDQGIICLLYTSDAADE